MKKINGIYITKCVSFPRSGHNWLTSILNSYFTKRFNYCEMYLNPESTIDVCENTNYQKSHDFGLDEPIVHNIKYVIQTRNFDDTCLSYYRTQKLNVKTIWDSKYCIQRKVDQPYVDTNTTEYITYKNSIKNYYDGFKSKWISSNLPNSIIIHYENMVNNPIKEISSVISFITDEDINYEKLKNIIQI
jgi:hypothetical protein